MYFLILEDPSCVDFFNWCHLVPQHGVCNHKFYGKQCCKSCTRKIWSWCPRQHLRARGLPFNLWRDQLPLRPGAEYWEPFVSCGCDEGACSEKQTVCHQAPISIPWSTWYSEALENGKRWQIWLLKNLWFALLYARSGESHWDMSIWEKTPFEFQRIQGQRHLF